MGTPDFAVEPLRVLVEDGYNIVAVITMPDKPAGRGHKVQFSPVKQYALQAGLPILQPEKLKDPDFIEQLRTYNADLQIVVAFRMLPEIVWSMPRLGTFNLHASLLPQYRGAAPINWAIINGDKQTGITTFFLKHEIDTGDMIMQQAISIGEDENVGSVHDRLMELGGQLVKKTVDLILTGEVTTRPQPESNDLRPAPKIFRETCQINFNRNVREVHNFVRGLSPYPAAWAALNLTGEEQVYKIYETRPIVMEHNLTIGSIVTDHKTYIRIACSDGFIELLTIQMAGKKSMPVRDFLNGLR